MDLPIKASADVSAKVERRALKRISKVPVDLKVCKPVGVQREQPLWRTDRIDFYHLLEAGVTIKHTPG